MQLTLHTLAGTEENIPLHTITGCSSVTAYFIFMVWCAAPGGIHENYPRASHQPASFCSESLSVLFPFIAFQRTIFSFHQYIRNKRNVKTCSFPSPFPVSLRKDCDSFLIDKSVTLPQDCRCFLCCCSSDKCFLLQFA